MRCPQQPTRAGPVAQAAFSDAYRYVLRLGRVPHPSPPLARVGVFDFPYPGLAGTGRVGHGFSRAANAPLNRHPERSDRIPWGIRSWSREPALSLSKGTLS